MFLSKDAYKLGRLHKRHICGAIETLFARYLLVRLGLRAVPHEAAIFRYLAALQPTEYRSGISKVSRWAFCMLVFLRLFDGRALLW